MLMRPIGLLTCKQPFLHSLVTVSCPLLSVVLLFWITPGFLSAATTSTIKASADTFVCTGTSQDYTQSNFGAAGTLAISSSSSAKGEFDSLLRFNLATAIANFDTEYGSGNWKITSVQLKLRTNYGIANTTPNNSLFNTISGGLFSITWLTLDNWTEGTGTPNLTTSDGVTYSDLSTLESGGTASLGTFLYTPPGRNDADYFFYDLPLDQQSFVNDLLAGGDVSLLFAAADTQIQMLFNSITKQYYEPYLVITADVVPEPTTTCLLVVSLALGIFLRRGNSIRPRP